MKNLTLFRLFVWVLIILPAVALSQNKNYCPDQSQKKNTDYLDSAFYFENQDARIFFRKWQYPSVNKVEEILLIIHGLGFHGEPYRKIMNNLYNNEIIVYSMDLRGHGLSGNIRGHLESNEKILKDIDGMISIISNDNPEVSIFLLGSSMGGAYALGYAITDIYRDHIAGLILAGAALIPHSSQIYMPGNIAYFFPLVFNRSKPVVLISGKRLEMSSSNPELIYTRRHDSLSLQYVSIDYLSKIRRMQNLDKNKNSLEKVTLPVLIQHGGKDKIADIRGAQNLKLSLIYADCKLYIYPESRHCLFWEPDSANVVKDLLSWMLKN